ncbi:MAG: NUDIX hydrolase [Candidatus Aenigmarchaeota archaeon]|nr:NUDIX hydrolase [Candidatus Aenigmarchaeota archaeon]
MTKNAKFHVGVKALIKNKNNEILLIKSGAKKPKVFKQDMVFWDFPGGKIKIGENVEKAMIREVEEEIHNKIEIEKIFDATVSNFRDNSEKNLFLMIIVYKCKLLTKKSPKLSWEHSEWNWFPLVEAKKLLSVKYTKSFVNKLDKLA